MTNICTENTAYLKYSYTSIECTDNTKEKCGKYMTKPKLRCHFRSRKETNTYW